MSCAKFSTDQVLPIGHPAYHASVKVVKVDPVVNFRYLVEYQDGERKWLSEEALEDKIVRVVE